MPILGFCGYATYLEAAGLGASVISAWPSAQHDPADSLSGQGLRRTRSAHGLWPDAGYPRFRRDPFARDVLLDPGGTTMPRITALHMLRSTITTVSAPANSSFRGSIPHPTQPLCTLRVRRYRRLTQHSLPGGLLGLTWAGLAPADRASFAWRLPSFDHLVGAGEQRRDNWPKRNLTSRSSLPTRRSPLAISRLFFSIITMWPLPWMPLLCSRTYSVFIPAWLRYFTVHWS